MELYHRASVIKLNLLKQLNVNVFCFMPEDKLINPAFDEGR